MKANTHYFCGHQCCERMHEKANRAVQNIVYQPRGLTTRRRKALRRPQLNTMAPPTLQAATVFIHSMTMTAAPNPRATTIAKHKQ